MSSQIDGFQGLLGEVEGLRIPIVAAAVPPNWEELAGAGAFILTMLCAVFARNAAVLTADLVISVIVAVVGFAVVSANPENLGKAVGAVGDFSAGGYDWIDAVGVVPVETRAIHHRGHGGSQGKSAFDFTLGPALLSSYG